MLHRPKASGHQLATTGDMKRGHRDCRPLTDSAPEAFDITDAELAREIVAAERERLLTGG